MSSMPKSKAGAPDPIGVNENMPRNEFSKSSPQQPSGPNLGQQCPQVWSRVGLKNSLPGQESHSPPGSRPHDGHSSAHNGYVPQNQFVFGTLPRGHNFSVPWYPVNVDSTKANSPLPSRSFAGYNHGYHAGNHPSLLSSPDLHSLAMQVPTPSQPVLVTPRLSYVPRPEKIMGSPKFKGAPSSSPLRVPTSAIFQSTSFMPPLRRANASSSSSPSLQADWALPRLRFLPGTSSIGSASHQQVVVPAMPSTQSYLGLGLSSSPPEANIERGRGEDQATTNANVTAPSTFLVDTVPRDPTMQFTKPASKEQRTKARAVRKRTTQVPIPKLQPETASVSATAPVPEPTKILRTRGRKPKVTETNPFPRDAEVVAKPVVVPYGQLLVTKSVNRKPQPPLKVPKLRLVVKPPSKVSLAPTDSRSTVVQTTKSKAKVVKKSFKKPTVAKSAIAKSTPKLLTTTSKFRRGRATFSDEEDVDYNAPIPTIYSTNSVSKRLSAALLLLGMTPKPSPAATDSPGTEVKGRPGRKSGGCWTCKCRRKKCDESRPGCLACSLLGLDCDGYALERPVFMTDPKLNYAYRQKLAAQVRKTKDAEA